jgi:hypothetical protein
VSISRPFRDHIADRIFEVKLDDVAKGKAWPAARKTPELDNRKCRFEPEVQVIRAGPPGRRQRRPDTADCLLFMPHCSTRPHDFIQRNL